MKRTISVLVENQAGVLSRISGLFARRAFNIDSLAVGVTDDKSLSRITIVVDDDPRTLEQIEKQLHKLIDVIRVRSSNDDELISRELVLIKVSATVSDRADVINICEVFGARAADISASSLTVELADTSERIDLLEELLKPFHIKEIARTGTIALQKGAESIQK